MSAFLDPDASGSLAFRQIVPVFDDHKPVADAVAEQVFQRRRHRSRAFARAEHADTAVGVEVARPCGGSRFIDQGQPVAVKAKVAQHGHVGRYGVQGRIREAAQFGGCWGGRQIGHGAAPVVSVGEVEKLLCRLSHSKGLVPVSYGSREMLGNTLPPLGSPVIAFKNSMKSVSQTLHQPNAVTGVLRLWNLCPDFSGGAAGRTAGIGKSNKGTCGERLFLGYVVD